MEFIAYTSREGQNILVQFPDCPGCQTFAESADELRAVATEALEGWIEAELVARRVPPRPKDHKRAPAGTKILTVPIGGRLSAALAVRWARQDAHLSQDDLGKKAGVSQQQIAKIENPDGNPTVDTLEKVAAALGMRLDLAFSATQQ